MEFWSAQYEIDHFTYSISSLGCLLAGPKEKGPSGLDQPSAMTLLLSIVILANRLDNHLSNTDRGT